MIGIDMGFDTGVVGPGRGAAGTASFGSTKC